MTGFSSKPFCLGAFRLLTTLCLTAALGGCTVNYHFCPPGAAEDPSRPFAPCKTGGAPEPPGR